MELQHFDMSVFIVGFWIINVLCVLIFLKSGKLIRFPSEHNLKRFQIIYLAVYFLATGGDWLQGPYIYALYKHYGFSSHDINRLFVAGYGSSLLFGTIVGSLADRYGRKKNCLLYGLFYIASCITKHFPNYYILLLGRILSGISTSILCSAFESWMVCEHNKKNFNPSNLPTTFSQVVLGNSFVAIISGVVAQLSADAYGYVTPYDVAVGIFSVMIILICILWVENYGDQKVEYFKSFKNAALVVASDTKIQCLGLVQSLFEGSMYIFVLEWTPSLTPKHDSSIQFSSSNSSTTFVQDHRNQIPHGYIFASFMVAIMTGSMIFKICCQHVKVEWFLRPLLFFSSFCFLFPILFEGNQAVIYACFIMFEMCVGAFWPSLGTLRSKYIPEQNRAAIMCFFRIPLNLLVITILIQNITINFVFACCFVFLMLGSLIQNRFVRLVSQDLTI